MNAEELIPLVVAGAVAAAGPKGNRRDSQWRNDIVNQIGPVAELFDEQSHAHQEAAAVLGAKVFVATYRGYDLEQSSQRLLVHLGTKRDEPERDIRTHRMDDPRGPAMKARLDDLPQGCEVLVWRAMEEVTSTKKARTLVHIKFLRRGDGATQAPTGSPSRPVDEAVPESPTPPVDSGAQPVARTVIDDINELDNATKRQVMAAVRRDGLNIANPVHDPKIRALIDAAVAR